MRVEQAISPSISAALTMKTIQPWNSCRKPSAMSMPQCSTMTPMMPTRKLFMSTVIGMLDRNSSDPFPRRALVEVRHQETQGHERKQVAQSAAGLRDLQLVAAEVDDIALDERR